jgi:hypothetical protein
LICNDLTLLVAQYSLIIDAGRGILGVQRECANEERERQEKMLSEIHKKFLFETGNKG